jgi:hypothetical protein
MEAIENGLELKAIPRLKSITPDIYNDLPGILKHAINVLTDPEEKAVFLMGALGVLSGVLPNIYGVYDGMIVFPNLNFYVLGKYGSGKGALKYAKILGQSIHREKLQYTTNAKEVHESEVQKYNEEFKRWKKFKLGDPPVKPPEPKQKLLFIPANSSNTGFLELLFNNDGIGIMFETEGDTLSDTLKQDWGNLSDGLRKAYHHEPISFYRRMDKEFVEIEHPRLSVILSSTFDQLLTLIPTAENGLFSRFSYYQLKPDPKFKNVFDDRKREYISTFNMMGDTVHDYYRTLLKKSNPIPFRFTGSQSAEFLTYFKELKKEIQSDITYDLDGTVNRLGLQFFRIAMILNTLRELDMNSLTDEIICSRIDFDNTMKIINVLKENAIDVFLKLPQSKEFHHKAIDKADQVKKAMDLKMSGMSYDSIAIQMKLPKTTIWNWLNR